MTLFKRDLSGSPSRPASSDASTHKKARSRSPSKTRGKAPSIPKFLRQSPEDLSQKFKHIEQLQRDRLEHAFQEGSESPWITDTSENAMHRNRYVNIAPWTANRVRLNVPEPCNDYINASPIVLERTKTCLGKQYIATQGPRQSQAGHLWRMAYEQVKSEGVIVMLTKPYEAGREKCFEYYPNDLEAPPMCFHQTKAEFGDDVEISVKLLGVTYHEAARADVRKLHVEVKHSSESSTPSNTNDQNPKVPGKIIWHLFFKGWPDWSVPSGDDKEALLELINLANEKNNNDPTNPLIVHCSAGVGRSGTFITLDHFITELNDGSLMVEDDYDPIHDIINRLREQRMFMVQSEVQLHYIYKVLREKFIARYQLASSGTWASSVKETFDNARRTKNTHLKP